MIDREEKREGGGGGKKLEKQTSEEYGEGWKVGESKRE